MAFIDDWADLGSRRVRDWKAMRAGADANRGRVVRPIARGGAAPTRAPVGRSANAAERSYSVMRQLFSTCTKVNHFLLRPRLSGISNFAVLPSFSMVGLLPLMILSTVSMRPDF